MTEHVNAEAIRAVARKELDRLSGAAWPLDDLANVVPCDVDAWHTVTRRVSSDWGPESSGPSGVRRKVRELQVFSPCFDDVRYEHLLTRGQAHSDAATAPGAFPVLITKSAAWARRSQLTDVLQVLVGTRSNLPIFGPPDGLEGDDFDTLVTLGKISPATKNEIDDTGLVHRSYPAVSPVLVNIAGDPTRMKAVLLSGNAKPMTVYRSLDLEPSTQDEADGGLRVVLDERRAFAVNENPYRLFIIG